MSGITLEKLNWLFRLAKNMKDVPHEFVDDGCWARAHIVCERFAKLGFEFEKLWVKDAYCSHLKDRFNYHVAPIIKVGDLWYVLDVSLCASPVSLKEYLKITKVRKSVYRYSIDTIDSKFDKLLNKKAIITNRNVLTPSYDLEIQCDEYMKEYNVKRCLKFYKNKLMEQKRVA